METSPLSEYVRTGSRAALDQLIRSQIDFVYAAAVRQLRDPHLAQDVTQAVFLVLAKRAKSIRSEAALPSWLFKTTRYAAANAIKMEQRRRKHEQAAAIVRPESAMQQTQSETDELIPLLDQAIAYLVQSDRQIILLRYLQSREFSDVAVMLGISEVAARKRLTRAVDRLRQIFASRGQAIEYTALATTLTAASTQAAPATVTTAVLSGAPPVTAATLAQGIHWMLIFSQAKAIAAVVVLVILTAATTKALIPSAKQPLTTAPPSAVSAVAPTTQLDNKSDFEITCLDPTAKPIPGAQVYLQQSLSKITDGPDPLITTIGPITTDSTGAAHFPNLPALHSTDREMRRVIYARLPGKLVGFDSQYWYKGDEKFPPLNLTLILTASVTLHGKLTVPPGLKPDSSFIQTPVLMLSRPNGPYFWRTSPPTDNLPPNTYDVPVNPDGTFTINDFPAQGHATLIANAPQLAEAEQDVSTAHLPDIQMRPQSVIQGRLTAPDGSPVANASVQITATIGADLIYRHPFNTKTDADGRYTINRLPDCYLGLIVTAPNLVLPVQPINLETGQTIEKNLTLQTGVLVIGRAVDPQGNPLPGVELSGCSPAGLDASVSKATTDSAGRYSIRMPIGQASIYVSDTPDGFDSPKQPDREKSIMIPENVTTIIGPNWRIPLAKPAAPYTTAMLTGRVIDEHGNGVPNLPIQDATVEGPNDPIQVYPDIATTDSTGHYSAEITANLPHQLSPVSDDFTSPKTRGINPQPHETVAFPDLIVHARPVIGTISCIVTDAQGHPLDNFNFSTSDTHGWHKPDNGAQFTIPVRRQQTTLLLSKSGYKNRNWNDLPPNARDVQLILYPESDTGPDYKSTTKIPSVESLLSHPVPPLHVDWVITPPNHIPTSSLSTGRLTVLAFDWDEDKTKPQAFAADLAKICSAADAVPIIIYSPESTPSGVRAVLPDLPPNLCVGIDQFFAARFANDPSGSTRLAYGAQKMRTVYVISPDGTLIYTQEGLKGLDSHLLN